MNARIERAITVRQPYAALIANGHKRYETRGYQPRCVERGDRIAIHAGSSTADVAKALHRPFSDVLPGVSYAKFGVIVATATFAAAWPTEILQPSWPESAFGDYSLGRFAWQLTDVRPLAEPIPCRGALGLWAIPEDVQALLAEGGRA